jgi:quercetin dioxygenase-like cupin family protein
MMPRNAAITLLIAFAPLSMSPLQQTVAQDTMTAETIELLQLSPDEIDWGDESGELVRRSLVGDPAKAGMYAYRVRFPAGTRIDPHYHPDNRIVTVIEGTLHMGYGVNFDEEAMRPLEAGSLWTEPGGQAHYVWAKDGAVVIQIIGYGPTATTQIDE